MIEQKLMAERKYELAKKYIIYRYTREMVRRANTTDDSIMSLIKNSNKDVMEENSNKNAYIASTQRDLIAGEVSKDLTKRVLLPEKIIKAHEDGVIHFHDMDYYLQSIFNCCLINIGDMLELRTFLCSGTHIYLWSYADTCLSGGCQQTDRHTGCWQPQK